MENFFISLRIVLTMAVPLMIGVILRLCKTVKEDFNRTANRLVYSVCLPVSLACSIYKSEFGTFPISAAVWILVILVAAFGVLMLCVPRIVSDRAKAAAVVQAIFRGNASIYGIPIATALYGSNNIGLFCILVTVGLIGFNVLSIFTFSLLTKKNKRRLFIEILRNPSIWGILIGLFLKFLKIPIPGMLYDAISPVGSMVTPLCFLGIGTTFSLSLMRSNWKYVSSVCASKLILLPMVALSIAIFSGFRNDVLLSFLAVFATPCAVASYSMADQMGGDAQLSAQCIVATTSCSLLTIFLWIFLLKQFALI